MKSELITAKKIFIAGIGGIGTSGLARILKAQGKEVSGSDMTSSEITEELVKEGIDIRIGHKEKNWPANADLLIYSAAVPKDNPERNKAKQLGIRQLSYPEAVGELIKSYEKVIAVAGTNGKTTTTAMIGWILEQAGEDPTVLVGSKVLAWNSNARIGGKKYFVVEADEYRRAFLNYQPDVAVITNIEADHLDYFNGLEDVKKAFREFAGRVKPGGTLVVGDLSLFSLPRPGEGLREGSNQVKKIKYEIGDYDLKVPGKFNQANASAAAAASRALGISDEVIKGALESFSGTWRRFEYIGSVARRFIGKTEIISDYAHHPTALRFALQTVFEEYPGKKVLAVFQPHQRNRTKNLFKDFVKVFCESRLRDFIIAEIFDVAGREEDKDKDISSRDLALEMSKCGKNVQYAANLGDVEQKVLQVINNYDIVLIMGAGDIYKVANLLAT